MEDLKLHRFGTVHVFKDGEATKEDVFLKDLKVVADLTADMRKEADKRNQVMTREAR